MTVEWRGDDVTKAFHALVSRNMSQAVLYLKGQVQRSINRGNADGSNPSLPGEPPKKVSARLFQSVATDKRESPVEITGVVGTNADHGRRLELGFTGTDKLGRVIDQAPRPFLRPALDTNRDAITRILGRK